MGQTQNPIKTVQRENAFYFFNDIGNYTGKNAASLDEFAKQIREVNLKSLEFHSKRGDFDKWLAGTLKEDDLARQMRDLEKRNLTGESLRLQLSELVSRRLQTESTGYGRPVQKYVRKT
jgi:hypothetical protein